MTFTAAVPNQRVDYALYFPDFDMRSAGEMKLEPSGQGTRDLDQPRRRRHQPD